MRVLVLHSRYLSGPTSGENRVLEDETLLMQKAGHDVHVWAPAPERTEGLDLVRTGAGALWSRHATEEVKRLVRRYRPEIVHCHNLFPTLSPAVIRTAVREGSVVVITLHNYRMMCLPATFLREGRVCEDCLGKVPWRGVAYRCYRGSILGSATLAGSLTLHRGLGTFKQVALFLATSRFVAEKHVEAGLPANKVVVKPNFTWEMPRRDEAGGQFLYLGRLATEKGVATLLEAWRGVPGRLLVVGEGPEEQHLRAAAPDNVEFRGSVSPSEIPPLLQSSRALLVPSMWYEGAPRVILEAFATGVPVLASRIGALAEVVENEVSGLLLPPTDGAAWREAAIRMLDDYEVDRLGEGAFRSWDKNYRPEIGLRHLEDAYQLALSANG